MTVRLVFSLENLLGGINGVLGLDEAGGREWKQALGEFSFPSWVSDHAP